MSATRYGGTTKLLHWLVFLLVMNQFIVGPVMMRVPSGETVGGYTQGQLYEWHKSIGLTVLAVMIVRYVWRRAATLPDWAPNLSDGEKRVIHWTERLLYVMLFAMPISGFLFVMAGNFGVQFFNRWDVPHPIGPNATLARAGQVVHETGALVLAAGLLVHWGVIIRHHWLHRDRYVRRMLPFTDQ